MITWSIERVIVGIQRRATRLADSAFGVAFSVGQAAIIAVGEALLRRLDHDYDHPLPEDLTRHRTAVLTCPCGTTKWVDGSERSVNESSEEFQREHAFHAGPEDATPPKKSGYTLADIQAIQADIAAERWGPYSSPGSIASPGDGGELAGGRPSSTAPPSPPRTSAATSQRGPSPAEVSGQTPEPPSAGHPDIQMLTDPDLHIDLASWADQGILEVLRAHRFWRVNASSIGSAGHCSCGFRPLNLREWEAHATLAISAFVRERALTTET